MNGQRLRTSVWGLGLLAVVSVLSVGCASGEKVWLVQPRLTGWQRELKLQSEQVRWSRAGGEAVERVLAEFPLPGARTGRPTYLLYLRLPAGMEQVSFEPEARVPAGGFLIQTRGEFAGLARATGGFVQLRGASSTDDVNRRYLIDLGFEDDSHLIGEIEATRDDYFVSQFETRRRPGDVMLLVRQIGEAKPDRRPEGLSNN